MSETVEAEVMSVTDLSPDTGVSEDSNPATILATVTDSDTPEKRKSGFHSSSFTPSEIGLMCRLEAEGLSQRDIAQRLNCTQPTVCRVLNEWRDTAYTGKLRAKAAADKLTQELLDRKDKSEDTLLELADRLDTIPKKRDKGAGGGGVVVNVGSADKVGVQINGNLWDE